MHSSSTDVYAVPKFLFVNVCSLNKIRNGICEQLSRSKLICIQMTLIFVLYQKRIYIPISLIVWISIPNFDIYCRDRIWGGVDKRKNGGIAIFIKSTLRVLEMKKAKQFELISLKIQLPSGNTMLIIGIYHLPRPIYQEQDLLHYIIEIMMTSRMITPEELLYVEEI